MAEMRDRLIELIKQADNECANTKQCDRCKAYGKGEDCINYNIADHLIANGAILPPCKVGDTVFVVGVITQQITAHKVIGINYSEDGLFLLTNSFTVVSVAQQLGKTVFLTREEAEKECEGK